jgi:hypothetical protein
MREMREKSIQNSKLKNFSKTARTASRCPISNTSFVKIYERKT